MAIAERVKTYIEKRRIPYDIHELASFISLLQAAELGEIPPGSIAKGVVVKDEVGLLLVVLPATHRVDIDALSKLLHRKVALADEDEIKATFPDCLPRFVAPIGEAYGVRTIVDDSLVGTATVYFSAGDASRLIEISGKEFFGFLGNAGLARDFARPISDNGKKPEQFTAADNDAAGDSVRESEIKRRVQEVKDLPAIPQMAHKIIELRMNPNANSDMLARIVELDPSLAAQVIRYARSPFFSYQGKIDSIHTAISRVLGFEMVMNLALGIATARPFKIPAIGSLGLNAFWRHAIFSAALVQALSREMPSAMRPPAGLSYLAGLLHNFGFLILGHLFKREYCILSNLANDNPDVPIQDHERAVLGMEHSELGALLLEQWNMPQEIIVAVREHHREDYSGPHAVYPRLVQLADRLLKDLEMGDAVSADLPPELLNALGLKEIQTVMVMGKILEGMTDLNVMARALAAA
jgi:HD-like signal output (HDOD) protein/prolyl-tRNA editing enzyme YbaK/EbsC (Cys-tRNA(Pro) deacylase)